MGWLDRVGRVVRAQINSLRNEAEDPEKILEKAVMDMEQELIAMRRALAEAIATQKSTERIVANYQQTAQKWYDRAQLSLNGGNEASAREALMQRQSYQQQAQSLQAQLEEQNKIGSKLKKDLRTLEQKYSEAKAKKNLYIARLRSAQAQQKMHEIAGTLSGASPSSVFERVETKILELEAESQLTGASGQDSLEEKFIAIEGKDNLNQ
jgi:phage shock protein A